MAAVPWKPLFWSRVGDIHYFVCTCRGLLADVQRNLALPVPAADGDHGISMINVAEEMLVVVSRSLLYTLIFIGSLEVLSVRNIQSNDGEEQLALTNIRAARTHVKAVYDAVVRSLGHLLAAGCLIGHPRIPDVDDYIDAERLAAVADVDTAMAEAVQIDVLTAAAAVVASAFAPR